MKIVFCIDKAYKNLARVSIDSYKKYNPEAEIIVVSEYPIKNDIGYDKNFIIKLPKVFRNRGEGDRITNTAYLKLYLTELPYDKILYVDADTICQKPLEDLWNIPCEYINLTESHSYGKKQAQALNIPIYGLSGMMVMNLNELRKDNFTEKCIDFEKKTTIPLNFWQHEESIINCCFTEKLNFVPVKFNYCYARNYEKPVDYKDVYIMHFPGKDKSNIYTYSKTLGLDFNENK